MPLGGNERRLRASAVRPSHGATAVLESKRGLGDYGRRGTHAAFGDSCGETALRRGCAADAGRAAPADDLSRSALERLVGMHQDVSAAGVGVAWLLWCI